jgi:hypothetical protein
LLAKLPISGELNEIWLETAKGRVPPGRNTSLVVDPPNGKIPYTPEGQKRWDAVPKIGKPMLANAPEDRTLAERCITTDGLLVPNAFYNNYFEIVQAPGYVAIVTEMMHEVRVIPLDRRPHVGADVRTWSGDSRGWWEGQTLVVETTNFNDKKRFRGAQRAAASRRAVHENGCRHDRVPPHGHRSSDFCAAVDARERVAASGRRNLRGRLS